MNCRKEKAFAYSVGAIEFTHARENLDLHFPFVYVMTNRGQLRVGFELGPLIFVVSIGKLVFIGRLVFISLRTSITSD